MLQLIEKSENKHKEITGPLDSKTNDGDIYVSNISVSSNDIILHEFSQIQGQWIVQHTMEKKGNTAFSSVVQLKDFII